MKLKNILAVALAAVTLSSCLDLEPESSITDANYWKDASQYSAFNVGLQGLFRERTFQYFVWGELRSNIYAGTPFSGEAVRYSNLFNNTLDANTPEVSGFGGLYTPINQLNLMIGHAEDTDKLTDAERSKYLGSAYGMRAFLYFQLLRTYGKAVIHTEYTQGTTVVIGGMSKAEASADDVMKRIKEDIALSEAAYGDNMSFLQGRDYWSKVATEMLKAEVYLWSGKQMGGGNADYQVAKSAIELVKTADVALLDEFDQIFDFGNKDNKEIIFGVRSRKDEYTMFDDNMRVNFVMNKQNMGNYTLVDGTLLKDSEIKDMNGVNYIPLNGELATRLYREGDTRMVGTLLPVYNANDASYAGVLQYKYRGTLLAGASDRTFLNDYPIYRYADALLLLAEAKALAGEDPAEEINAVRKRAYGADYFAAHPEVQYPNDVDAAFYDANPFCAADNDAVEAVLKERCRELMFEGKRWHDLHLLDKCTSYSTANASRLYWPIDANALGENDKLRQTDGY